MGDRRPLASGDVLAHRYELQDLVTEKLGSSTWRAHDNILNRNVGLEMLPSSDPRADRFLSAARESIAVTDSRFLRVLDLIENEQNHHLVVREWARAFPLDQVLKQSPLPNRRAATIVAEVAEAMAHAHELGVYHRRLTPHQVLLKQSGAVRIVGLGVATALSSPDEPEDQDQLAYERADVLGLGRLLYACLTSHWPGHSVDGLTAAPLDHGRLLRPRQVRAGVSRDIDTVCDRILGDPPRHNRSPLTHADDVARAVRFSGEDDDLFDDQPSLLGVSSPDLLRLDPVIVPAGPPPGLEPPRRRPKAYEPAPPTAMERAVERGKLATKGDRALVLIGVVGAFVLASIIAFLVGVAINDGTSQIDESAPVRDLPIRAVDDFDPQGDGDENPDEVPQAVDGDLDTAWTTSRYLNRPDLGGLKEGVGLVVDLGGLRQIDSVRVQLGGGGTDLSILAAAADADGPPSDLDDLRSVASVDDVAVDTTVALDDVETRYLVVWLRSVPEADDGGFIGSVREIGIRGRS